MWAMATATSCLPCNLRFALVALLSAVFSCAIMRLESYIFPGLHRFFADFPRFLVRSRPISSDFDRFRPISPTEIWACGTTLMSFQRPVRWPRCINSYWLQLATELQFWLRFLRPVQCTDIMHSFILGAMSAWVTVSADSQMQICITR